MSKPAVYLETSVVSYLTARTTRHLLALAWQQVTMEWWQRRRRRYELFVSELVLDEARQGDAAAAARRLQLIESLPRLDVNVSVRALAARLLGEAALPPVARVDALHVAVATVHRMDYLLTWNCTHIANAERVPFVRLACESAGYRCPQICTPQELLGEEIEL